MLKDDDRPNHAIVACAIPPLDFATWRALGQGRSASRRLPPGMLDEAASVVKQVLRDVGEGAWIERDGKRLRVAGAAENGGLRIDGGPGGFRERTLSLVDVAWVLVARRDVERDGGVLDEARVNRLRYLEGTPKGATRTIRPLASPLRYGFPPRRMAATR